MIAVQPLRSPCCRFGNDLPDPHGTVEPADLARGFPTWQLRLRAATPTLAVTATTKFHWRIVSHSNDRKRVSKLRQCVEEHREEHPKGATNTNAHRKPRRRLCSSWPKDEPCWRSCERSRNCVVARHKFGCSQSCGVIPMGPRATGECPPVTSRIL